MAMIHYVSDHKITTLPVYISALANWAELHDLGPLPRYKLFDKVKKGLHNYFGLTEISLPKLALSMEHLYQFYQGLDLTTFSDSRDWCAYLFAFFATLRISEYCSSSLTHSCVQVYPWGVALVIPFSKTTLTPTVVKICRRDDSLCPVKALSHYLSFLPNHLTRPHFPFFIDSLPTSAAPPPQPSSSPPFPSPDPSSPSSPCSPPLPMSRSGFVGRLKSRIRSLLHLDPSLYSGHSFRRGGTTALFLAGVPETIIALHGRWKSLTYRKYFQWSNIQQLLPTQLLLTNFKLFS